MPNDIIITPVSASIQFSGSAYASIKLTVDASGSLLVSGNSGSLFSITDNLSGSLMSVNTIAGLPIMEVFSDNRVNIGKYASEAIKVQSGGSDVAFGSGSVMFVTSSGRVGIGVNTPLNKLDVAGNISCSAITASFFGTSSWSTNSLTASSLISGNSYNITNLTASNISTSATGSFGTITSSGNIQVGPYNVSSITPTQLVFGNYQTSGTTRPQFIFNGVASWMGLGQLTTSSVNQLRLGTVSLPNTNWGTFGATAFNLMIDGGLSIGTTASLNNGLLISGSVGIGTTSPSQLLDISGSFTSLGGWVLGGNPGGPIGLGAGSSAATRYIGAGGSTTNFYHNVPAGGTFRFNIAESEKVRIDSAGNVGIGTTNPAYLLDVSGSSRFGYRSADTHQFTGSVSISGSLSATSSWSTNALTASYVSSSNVVGTVTSSSYALSASFAPTTITASWSTNSLTASSLVVGNSYNITNLTASNISASGTGSFGMVGIGTTSPVGKLVIYGTATNLGRYTTFSAGGVQTNIFNDNGAGVFPFVAANNQNGANFGSGYGFALGYGGGQQADGTSVAAGNIAVAQETSYTATTSSQDSYMKFSTSLDGTVDEKMRITSTGNVSIGLTGSVNRLDVAGNISCSVITASLFNGTSSWSTNSLTASYVTSSNVVGTVTSASYALSASSAPTTITASWATNALTASSLVSANSYTITNLTASNIRSNGTLHVNLGTIDCAVTGATLFVSANAITIGGGSMTTTFPGVLSVTGASSLNSTLTVLGATVLNNTLSASGVVTASNIYGAGTLNVVGVSTLGTVSASIFVGAHTGSLFGTSSWSTNALTASSLVVGNSYNITNLTASNISASGIGSFGNVGIGTTAPLSLLTLEHGAVVVNSSGFRIRNTSGNSWVTDVGIPTVNESSYTIRDVTAATYPFIIAQSTGNVGIGTTNPAYLLDVSGSSRFGYRSADTHQFTGSVSISGSLNATSSWATNSLTASSLVVGNSYNITNLTASNISASGTGSFGRVGIGTLNPSGSLDVSGSIYTSAKLVQRSTTQSLSGTTGCTIDLSSGVVHILSLASATTISSFTYSNRDNNPHVNTIMLVLKYSGTATVTFTNVIWANGVTPSLTGTSGYADVFMLTSYQGGAVTPVWLGTVVSQALVSTNL